MGSYQDPGFRPSGWEIAGDHESRIGILEADPGGSTGTGIEFDTDNQGGYLDVTTNDVDGAGLGLKLDDESGGGILITSDGGAIGIDLESDGSRIEINDAAAGVTIIGGNSPGGRVLVDCGPVSFEVVGDTITFYDSAANKMLEMTAGDPDLHIRAGGTVVADL